MRKAVLLLATMALAILLGGGVAQAIINGEPDGNMHPYVGMVYNDELMCSGTLISPTVFLTAGHCTAAFEEGASQVYVTFEPRADFEPDAAYTGTPYTHPGYVASDVDVGVIVLDTPVHMDTYGRLPSANLVDTFHKGTGTFLTAVGYGGREFSVGGGPPELTSFAIRYRATVTYIGFVNAIPGIADPTGYILVSAGSMGEGGEGACFGDSGGPYLLPDQTTIVALHSGGGSTCSGTAYAYRIDLPVVLDWVSSFL